MPFSNYQPERMGSAAIEPASPQVAGELAEITLVYRAGDYGIDDSGMLKVSWRTTSDMEKPQFTDPQATGYTTVEASNGAELVCWVDRVNIRPWTNTLCIRIGRGYLRKDDTITVRFGDRRGGSPGIRLQSNVEKRFCFKIFVDAFATYEFTEMPDSPAIALVAGKPVRWKAVVPSAVEVGETFELAVTAQDRWGNPAAAPGLELTLSAPPSVRGLPATVVCGDGEVIRVGPLTAAAADDVWVAVADASGRLLCRSNPMRSSARLALRRYWGDLHGQSEETVGTNSAEDHFLFARDLALLDITSHQGNDFQIDDAFWARLNELTARFDVPGRFLALPGYEWSGNTGLGGDRNVFYRREGRPIHRSSHILLPGGVEEARNRPSACDLFSALEGEDAVVIAHVGGRYADVALAHDHRLETSVEVHSSWGTFEWILHDALAEGHRVGVVCHSDDHKGRPGATTPGASSFGAIGGLTCYLMPELTRDALFEALRRRHHYGTTGTRIHLDVRGGFDAAVPVLPRDPRLGDIEAEISDTVTMGDIVRAGGHGMRLSVDVLGTAPVHSIDVFHGARLVLSHRPGASADSRRLAIRWEGAEYRGRGRETFWNGRLRAEGVTIEQVRPVNFLNPALAVDEIEPGRHYAWKSVTTGNLVGIDLVLDAADAGTIHVETGIAELTVDLATLGAEPVVAEAGGLGRRIWVERMIEEGAPLRAGLSHEVAAPQGGDLPVYVRVTQDDCNRAWSSPIYLI